MNLFRKLDVIPPPYSTVIALIIPTLFSIFLIVRHDDLRLLGMGIIIGAFLAVILKKGVEVSDRGVLSKIIGLFRRKNTNNAD